MIFGILFYFELLFSSFWHRGPIRGKRCIQINVPTKPSNESWERSYLCWPHDGIYKFKWLTQAPSYEERGNCLEWTEPRDPTWSPKTYYLCATKDHQPIGMYVLTWQRCNHTVIIRKKPRESTLWLAESHACIYFSGKQNILLLATF